MKDRWLTDGHTRTPVPLNFNHGIADTIARGIIEQQLEEIATLTEQVTKLQAGQCKCAERAETLAPTYADGNVGYSMDTR